MQTQLNKINLLCTKQIITDEKKQLGVETEFFQYWFNFCS